MIKYKIFSGYDSVSDRILFSVFRKRFIFWKLVTTASTREKAQEIIASIEKEQLLDDN